MGDFPRAPICYAQQKATWGRDTITSTTNNERVFGCLLTADDDYLQWNEDGRYARS
jgi:hypothetical protein